MNDMICYKDKIDSSHDPICEFENVSADRPLLVSNFQSLYEPLLVKTALSRDNKPHGLRTGDIPN